MTGAFLALAFGSLFSLAASSVLVTRIERLGERFQLTEAMLGLVAALAADAPEITSATAALLSGQRSVGVGVVLGSNVFNLAALLGLGALVAGRITLHRRVVLLEGAVALWMALVAVTALSGTFTAPVGLTLTLIVLLAYGTLCALSTQARRRLPLPHHWLDEALAEEEEELHPAIHPSKQRPDDRVTALTGAVALIVVIAASLVMENAATRVGTHYAIPGIVTGGIILAAITSLPNAVTAVYLARKARGAATLSEAMNSNTLNVTLGLFLPATLTTLAVGGSSTQVAWWYAGMTLGVLSLAYFQRGLTRLSGAAIIAAYAVFVVLLVR